MAKKTNSFLCQDCGENFVKWVGKCPNCGAFDTIKEFKESKISEKVETGVNLLNISKSRENSGTYKSRISTQIGEVNRVLGGGFFPGSVILFGGHPGIGKSTLSLQLFLNIQSTKTAFYFSGEENISQVKNRASRLNSKTLKSREILDHLHIFATNSLEDILETIQKNKPDFVVIDSIQMIGTKDSTFGSITQIRENAELLIKIAKNLDITILVIGHVTKNDELAGPKILEHLVDGVLYLEGERNSEIRILRSPKNRFGSTLEIGVFEMCNSGLMPLENPSDFFLAERAQDSCGSVVLVVREGVRNFLMEIQALTIKTNFGNPRRTANGISLSKWHLLLAVVSKFTPFSCENFDAYGNVIGGFKIQDPAADLAIVAAILSSRMEKEIPPQTVVFGEVGLSGEVRSVTNLENRIIEAAKLGFKKIICPAIKSRENLPDIEIVPIKNIAQLLRVAF
jgi:DNA repair protein RadA/Sms